MRPRSPVLLPSRRNFSRGIVSILFSALAGGCGQPENPEPLRIRRRPFVLERVNSENEQWRLPPNRLDIILQRLSHERAGKYPDYVHFVRLWAQCSNGAASSINKEELLRRLLNANEMANDFGVIYKSDRNGISITHRDELRGVPGESHIDKTLSALAEAGVNSDSPLVLGNSSFHLADLVRSSAANFSWHQHLAFSAVGLSLYIDANAGWRDKHGQLFLFRDFIVRITNAIDSSQFCYGTHELFAIAALLQVGASTGWLDASLRKSATRTLTSFVSRLEAHQNSDGSWSADALYASPASHPTANDSEGVLAETITATGHNLEWLQLLPHDISVPDILITRSVNYLADTLLNISEARIDARLSTITHAATALLWSQPRSANYN